MTYIIAEIGSNHDQQLDRAKNLMYLAKEAGADAAKYQLYRADDLAQRRNAQAYWPIYKATELPDSWLPVLKNYADQLGIDFMCTAYSEWAIEAVAPYVECFKVASFEMGDHKLLAFLRGYAESTGKKVVLSTGMASIDEVMRSVGVLGPDNIAYVLHCASAYPCPPSDINLKAMATLVVGLGQKFATDSAGWWFDRIGLSDHTTSITAPVAAVALGAKCIEKHVTTDRNRVGPDHPFAIEFAEFKQMVGMIREVEVMLGDGVKERKLSEEAMAKYRVRVGA